MSGLSRFHILLFLIIVSVITWCGHSRNIDPEILSGDQDRYVNYAVSMHEFGVFGLSDRVDEGEALEAPAPGNANAPIYPMMILGLMKVDQNFADMLVCALPQRSLEGCEVHMQSFYILQVGLAVLALFLLYQISLRISGSHAVAWISGLLAAFSSVFYSYTDAFMTETLVLPGFLTLLLFCVLLYQKGQLGWVVAISVSLAFLTLVRPSYLYLFYAFAISFLGGWALKRNRDWFLKTLALIFVFIATVSPWAIRNKINFDSFTLTSGNYAEAILIQRINYNQMSWPEVGVAMIYYLPGFGDSLAEDFFPEELHNKLGWSEGTYYKQGYRPQLNALEDKLGDKDAVLGHLIKEDVLTLKHIAVSVPLAIRGALVAKEISFIGFIAFLVLLVQTLRRKEYALAIISLPLFFMVAFHAGLSVSIGRYNLPIIVLYTLSLAHFINLYGQRIVTKIRDK